MGAAGRHGAPVEVISSTMRRALFVVVVACGGGDKPAEPGVASSDPGSATPPAQKPVAAPVGLTVTSAGKAIPMQRAFIVRRSRQHWRLLVSDSEGTCDEARAGAITSKPGATTFSVGFAKVLKPDGSEPIEVYDFWTSTLGKSPRSFTGVTFEPYIEGEGEMTVSLPRLEMAAEGVEGSTFVAQGAVTAQNCGVDEPAVKLKATHVSAATLTLAGKQFEIKGAVLHGTEIALSTEPLDCDTTGASAEIELRHDADEWSLLGTRIGEVIKAKELPGTTFKVGAEGTSADGKIAAVAISGKSKIGGYKIELAGKVEALDCPVK